MPLLHKLIHVFDFTKFLIFKFFREITYHAFIYHVQWFSFDIHHQPGFVIGFFIRCCVIWKTVYSQISWILSIWQRKGCLCLDQIRSFGFFQLVRIAEFGDDLNGSNVPARIGIFYFVIWKYQLFPKSSKFFMPMI